MEDKRTEVEDKRREVEDKRREVEDKRREVEDKWREVEDKRRDIAADMHLSSKHMSQPYTEATLHTPTSGLSNTIPDSLSQAH